jgi:NADH-quinone oxidoreductase subunit N
MYAGQDVRYLNSFKILKSKNPFLVLIFVFLIFSMSGIPPLGGFFIKLDVLTALLESSRYLITIILFFFTVITFFYYLKIIKILYFENFESKFIKTFEINTSRLQLFILLFIFLLFYMFIVTNSTYEIGQSFFSDSL